jgi:glycosyltransferase involved in cell wall biosynthesis
LRILYVLTTLGVGGAEKQVTALAERMAARGHSVAFLVLKHASEEWPVHAPVLRLNLEKTPRSIFRGLRFARRFLSLFRPDIVHSHTFPANIFTRLLCLRLSIEGRSPAVLNTIHNVNEGGWHRMLLYRLTDPLVDQVTAVSTAAADRFTKWGAISRSKTLVLTNGIDTQAFAPDRARRRRTRAQTQAGENFIWLAVGRLAPAKDYPNLLAAFQQIRSPHTELWIAGEGDSSQLNTDDPSVRFLGLRRDILDLMDAADAFVLASAWEGLPLAVAEAMAMQKPIVATDVGGVRELVAETATLVPPKDSSALANAMQQTMQSRELDRKSKGQFARKRIEQYFSMDAKVNEWEAFYHRCLSGRSHEPLN